ncbi:MAG: hypothetical protein ACK5JD_06310 [Mangrovibacterium sp.]
MSSEPEILTEWPWWFPINQVEELENMAAIGYTPEKIAMYFDVDRETFMQDFARENSRIRYHYERGILVNEAKEAIATQQAANDGNATQAQRLDKKRFQIMFQQLKERIIYGKE